MKISIETKYNLGDLLYVVEPYYELNSSSEVLCGQSDNLFNKEKYPLQVIEIKVVYNQYDSRDEVKTYIQYDLAYTDDRYNNWNKIENVFEDNLFSNYNDALKALKNRKDKARAEVGW